MMRTAGRWALAAALAAGGCTKGAKDGADAQGDAAKSAAAGDAKPAADGGGKPAADGDGKGRGKRGGAGGGEQAGNAGGGGRGGRGGGGPVPVRVVTVERKLAPRTVEVVAPLAGRKQADVYSKVAGRITFLGPREGDPVKANEVLFRVDRSDPGESFLNTPVVSPLTGWVGRWRVVNVGEQVAPTDPVVTVVDDQALRASVFLPAEDWLAVKPDTAVTAIVAGESRASRIETIARAADLTSGRGGVTVEIPNPKRDWRVGLFARLRFDLAPKERMLLDASTLIITDQGAFVYVAEGESARRVPVKFNVLDADTVEVTSGLEPGAKVVTAGANQLGDKSQIKILDATIPKEAKAP